MENPLTQIQEKVADARGMRTSRGASAGRSARRSSRRRRQPFVQRVTSQWWDRLLSAVYSGSFSRQDEQYGSHETKRDYLWNSVGMGIWGSQFPILTIVATQLAGVELAGMFSMAFVTANLLLYVGNYGVRTYQVSDIDEDHSFNDYQLHRALTCVVMLLVGWLYGHVRGYGATMSLICLGCYLYRATDALADVYEGRLQQMDKLYLAGISQMLRVVASTIAFAVTLFVSRSVGAASVAMAVGSAALVVIVSIPMAKFETERSMRLKLKEVVAIFRKCAPLFAALFLYSLVDNIPKFVMEGILSYDNQLYCNVMYFPAHAIVMATGIIYKPQLVRLTNIWNDPNQRGRFNVVIAAMCGVIALITAVVAGFMGWLGIPILSFLYGVDFEQFRPLVLLMVLSGGFSAAIEFFCQIIAVLRQQLSILPLYLVGLVVALVASNVLINALGLAGTVYTYISVTALLVVMLVARYVSIWRRLSRRFSL